MNGKVRNGGKKIARKSLAGLLSFIVVMSIVSSAIAAAYLTITPEDSPSLTDSLSAYHKEEKDGKLDAFTSEIEVLSFSVNQMTEYSSWTKYVSISGGNPHFKEADLSGDDVVIYDYGESVCENFSYTWRGYHGGYWDELLEYHCVDHGLPYNVKPYTTKLSITFSRAENATEYNRCTILLEYINVTIRFSDGNLGYGYQSEGAGGIGNWSGNTFTASWDKPDYKGNLSVTLSQKPSLKHLVVKIEYPGNGFVARTIENVTIAAKVTDDQNNTVTGSSIDSVVASFTTNAQRTPPEPVPLR
jgi:hypothetical protein